MAVTLQFDHVHYRASSTDFAATKAFYVDILGATDLGLVKLAGNDNLQLELGGVLLLFAPSDKSPTDAVANSDRLGTYHIAFVVDNCDEALAYYESKGAKQAPLKDDPTPWPKDVGDNIRAAFLDAGDGMTVELKQNLA